MCIRDRTYAGQNKEVVFADVTFNNERQKADVSVVKQDKDTKKPLKGGIFALYLSLIHIYGLPGRVEIQKEETKADDESGKNETEEENNY